MGASTTSGTTTLQLANLHGDTVATLPNTPGATGIDSYTETDEYGNPTTTGTQSGPYGWLGAHQRSTDTLGGITLMGARLYSPTTGMFTTPDPVYGGNTTTYTYPQDPINQFDLDGSRRFSRHVRIAMRFFISRPRYGVRDAAAIVGNLMQESSDLLHTNDRNGDECNGIAQWCGSRWNGRRHSMVAFARRQAPNASHPQFRFRLQLRFILAELNGGERRARRLMLRAHGINNKTIAFEMEFERCGRPVPSECNEQARLQNARALLRRFRR